MRKCVIYALHMNFIMTIIVRRKSFIVEIIFDPDF